MVTRSNGWALVGDAGFYKHPIPAQGISDAFRDAELLTEAIDAGLTNRQPLELALAGYEQTRNEMVMPIVIQTPLGLLTGRCQNMTIELP